MVLRLVVLHLLVADQVLGKLPLNIAVVRNGVRSHNLVLHFADGGEIRHRGSTGHVSCGCWKKFVHRISKTFAKTIQRMVPFELRQRILEETLHHGKSKETNSQNSA